jgi:hypothetical protein
MVTRGTCLLFLVLSCSCGGSAAQPDVPRRENPWQPIADGIGRCGSTACTGCCRAGTCVAPSTDTSCGINGAACIDCTTLSFTCVNGTCQVCQPVCQARKCGLSDGCGSICQPGSGCLQSNTLLEDQFASTSIDGGRWGTAAGGGATVSVTGGELVLEVPAQANAYAEIFSKTSFPVGSVLEARVYLSAAQFYDHRGIGFSDRGIGADCNDIAGENQAAQWRAQDEAWVAEAKVGSELDCDPVSSTYAGGYRTIKIVRQASQVEYYEDGVSMKTITKLPQLSSAALPVRFSAFTYYSTGPAAPITVRVDWVKVYTP